MAQKQVSSYTCHDGDHCANKRKKSAVLTELKLESLDIVKDTIPGMSVDRAHADCLKDVLCLW
jgi:hypothetical protein